MNFTETFKKYANVTESENGGQVFKSTRGGALLDFFSAIGGMRDRSSQDIVNMWLAARRDNLELADNLVLYSRDIRNGGLGERNIGRILLTALANLDPVKVGRNLQKIVDVGRWDDLYCLVGTPVEREMWNFINNQLRKDLTGMRNNEPISLLAKWLKSENASSQETKKLARLTQSKLGLPPSVYRKTLSKLRAYIDVVEVKMSSGRWNEINFESVPSLAMSRYINAYGTRCAESFQAYKESLKKGTAKVNAAVLGPTDICHKFLTQFLNVPGGWFKKDFKKLDDVDIAQWNALPNYVEGNQDVVIMADVSGSMTMENGKPMAASVGLATYFAQRNTGAYKNMYMSFSSDPSFITIDDTMDLETCFYTAMHRGGMNTDMDKAFKAIYDVAIEANETPAALCVISDGELDNWVGSERAASIVDKWNDKFIEAGLNPVKVISWNVANRHNTKLAPRSSNISYCSGYSSSTFKYFTSLINLDAHDAMVEILSRPEFQWD